MIMMIWVTYISKLIFRKKSFCWWIWAQNWLLKSALKKPLRKLVRKMNFEKNFHRIRFFYLDVFWYDDRYWKASPGSTLNDFNDGLTIFHDLSSFFNKISASCKFGWKSWNSNFFSKNENRCLDPKFSKTVVRKWKPMLWRCF